LPRKSAVSSISPVAKKIEQAARKTSGVVEAPPARRKQKRHVRTNTKEDNEQADAKALVVRESQVMTPSSGEDSDVRVQSPKFMFILTVNLNKDEEKENETSGPSSHLPLESSADLDTSSVRMKQPENDGYNKWADQDRHSILQGQSTRPAVESLWDFSQVDASNRETVNEALHNVTCITAEDFVAAVRARSRIEEVISDEEDDGVGDGSGSPLADSVIGDQEVVDDGNEGTVKTTEG
jgi:hypothetical protein